MKLATLCKTMTLLGMCIQVVTSSVRWQCGSDISVLCLSQLTLIDLIIYGSLEAVYIHSVRWSRPLRPVFLINFSESRQVRV
jgi:two pore calcium channel protein 3